LLIPRGIDDRLNDLLRIVENSFCVVFLNFEHRSKQLVAWCETNSKSHKFLLIAAIERSGDPILHYHSVVKRAPGHIVEYYQAIALLVRYSESSMLATVRHEVDSEKPMKPINSEDVSLSMIMCSDRVTVEKRTTHFDCSCV